MKGKFSRLMLVAASTLAVVACGSGESDAKNAGKAGQAVGAGSAATRDWTTNVVVTPEGGYRMGNPDAKVKLVEFASLTCSHCRDFHLESQAVLKNDLVRSGRVSYEFRPFLLNGVDIVATLTAKCAPPQQFFTWADQLYRNHDAWVGGFVKAQQDKAAMTRLQALPENQQLSAFASAAGFDAFARLRGLPKARLDQCLADQATFNQLQAQQQAAQDQYQITGTPTFVVNGEKLQGVANWAALEPKIRELL